MWRETKKPGVFRHDDCPCCEVEIINYHCDDCELEQATYHRVACDKKNPGHPVADAEARRAHAVCSSGHVLTKA